MLKENISMAIKRLKNGKAPSADNLPPEFFFILIDFDLSVAFLQRKLNNGTLKIPDERATVLITKVPIKKQLLTLL